MSLNWFNSVKVFYVKSKTGCLTLSRLTLSKYIFEMGDYGRKTFYLILKNRRRIFGLWG